jgi:hypothetical protein
LSFCSQPQKNTKKFLVLKVSLWVIEPEKCLEDVFDAIVKFSDKKTNRKTNFAQNPKMFFHKTIVLRLFVLLFHFSVINRGCGTQKGWQKYSIKLFEPWTCPRNSLVIEVKESKNIRYDITWFANGYLRLERPFLFLSEKVASKSIMKRRASVGFH